MNNDRYPSFTKALRFIYRVFSCYIQIIRVYNIYFLTPILYLQIAIPLYG